MPSWVPDWRHTVRTPDSLPRFEGTNINWKPPYNASLSSTFPEKPFKSYTLPNLPPELHLSGYIIAHVTHITPRAWKNEVQPGRQTLRAQSLILQANQIQILDWEKFLRPIWSNPKPYAPTGESQIDASYKTLATGIYINESEVDAKAAWDAFESRQRIFRLFAMLGLQRFLWPYMLVVVVGHFLRWFGVQNPELKFRDMVISMANRKGARLTEEGGKTEYLALVPAMCEVGDAVAICRGVKVPLVLRRRVTEGEGEKKEDTWEFVGDAYVHGVMGGEKWDEESCRDICVV